MRKLRLFLIIFSFCSLDLEAQSPYVDSLFKAIDTVSDTQKVKVYRELCYEFLNSDFDKAWEFANSALKLAEKINDKKGRAYAWDVMGSVYVHQGDFKNGIQYKLKALKFFEEAQENKGIASTNNNLGVLYFRQNNYPKALEHYQKALKISQILPDSASMSTYLLNIGEVYLMEKNYPLALEYESKSLIISEILNKKMNIADNIAYAYGIIGKVYAAQKKYDLALEYQQKALKIFEKLQDQIAVIEYLLETARTYQLKQNWSDALLFAKSALSSAEKINSKQWIKEARLTLSEVYVKLGDSKLAYDYHLAYTALKDSMLNEETIKHTAQLQILHDTERKQAEIEILSRDKQLQADLIERRTLWLYVFIGGFLLIVGLAFMLFRKNYYKQKANEVLLAKNAEITRQKDQLILLNEEISQQKEEIAAQRDVLEQQKDEIEDINQDLTASIQYAKRIQEAILPFTDRINEVLPNHFILFKPRDIVSGDFYWFAEKDEKIILSAIDCTGHGVPGAFMSMIADSLLNYIILEKGITRADLILNEMHKGIRKALKQDLNNNKDGMDLALCVVDLKNKVLEYAGAHTPLVIVQNEELKWIKGDKFAIGGFQPEDERIFTLHQFSLTSPTTFYLFSDGYQDQFGGEDNKKFLPRRFREILQSIHYQPINTQKAILEQNLQSWMGKHKQIDDILVMGVRVG